jgi:predicted Zn-dependent peptidase
VQAELRAGVSHAVVEKEIWDEINKLRTTLISEHELEKVKNNVTAAQVNMLRSNEGLSDRLAYLEIGGDWRWINTYLDNVKAVSREVVRDAADKLFTEKNSTVGWVVNGKGGEQ